MAVQPAEQKASPDLGKINGMTQPMLMVTRHTSRTGAGQLVVPPLKGVNAEKITAMLAELPNKFGAGTYKFEVQDEGSTEKDVWTVKLQGDAPAEGSMAAGFSGVAAPMMNTGAPQGPLPEGVTWIGPGVYYNENLGLISMAGRPPVPWRPGEPWPAELSRAPAGAAPAASPWGMPSPTPSVWPPFPGVPGWGSMPATSSSESSEIAALKAQIADGETRRREDAHRAEMAELRNTFTRMFDDVNKRFETLLAKIGEKPAGPSPEFEAMRTELAAIKTTNEAQTREDRIRADMTSQQQRFETLVRELTANKSDPMMGFLGQIMQTFQQGQASTVQAMRDATASTTEKLSGSVMGPMQMMQMMQMLRDNPADKAQQELFSTIFTMMQGLLRTQAELNTDNTPPWMNMVGAIGEQIGGLAQAVLTARQQQPQPPQYIPPRQMQAQPQRQQVAQPQQRQQVAAQPQAAAPQAPAQQDPRAGAAAHVFGAAAGAAAVGGAEAQRAAAAASTGLYANGSAGTAVPPVMHAVDATPAGQPPLANGTHGAPAVAAPVAVAPDAVIPPAAPAQQEAPRRGRGRPRKEPVAPAQAAAAPATLTLVPEPQPAFVPRPVANPVLPPGINAEAQASAYANFSADELRRTVYSVDDPTFFGPLTSRVYQVREQVQQGMTPEALVDLLVQVPPGLQAYGAFPPVLELYNAGQFEIMMERLLPHATHEYRLTVANMLAERVIGDDSGGDEDDSEGEESDEDGDDEEGE